MARRKIILHVGCGPPAASSKIDPRFRGPDWQELRLDIDPGVYPDIVASIVDMSPVETGSVDAVWSSHNLEHVYSHEVPVVLRGFLRVLRAGGEVEIRVPDLQGIGGPIADGRLEDTLYVSPAGPIAAIDMLYGHRASVERGNEFMSHKTGFTAGTLAHKLEQTGFVDIEVRRETLELIATAKKPG